MQPQNRFYYGVQPFRTYNRKMPWTNYSNAMDYTSSSGEYNPAFSLKMLPLKDMAPPVQHKYSDFDRFVDNIKSYLKVGDKVKAAPMNSDLKKEFVTGPIVSIKIDYKNKTVRMHVRDLQSNQIVEIYPNTVYRENGPTNESHIMSFEEFAKLS